MRVRDPIMASERRGGGFLKATIIATFTLGMLLVTLSAYIRLSNAGLGCADWPACYGRIGPTPSDLGVTSDMVVEPNHPIGTNHAPAWATTAHRATAAVLGVLVLALAAVAAATRGRATGGLAGPALLMLSTVGLAVLGKWSAGLHRPIVVFANFAGGVLMVSLLWRLVLGAGKRRMRNDTPSATLSARWTALGLGLVALQAMLGGLVSVNFAALSCTAFPDCNGVWWPALTSDGLRAMFHTLQVDAGGRVLRGEWTGGLHMAHRFAAAGVLFYVSWLGMKALRSGHGGTGVIVLALLALETATGMAVVKSHLALGVVLAHYFLGLLLLFGLLALHYRIGNPAMHDARIRQP